MLSRYDVSSRDNLKARAVYTQVNVLVRIVLVVIGVLAVACLLMTFEKVRQVGVSLLASAGIAGVIAGFAAQRSLGALFAGIQIAITQPIRIDDVVIVEGEWGKIEEIALTYVVVQIWDLRRLIVAVTYFLQTPFRIGRGCRPICSAPSFSTPIIRCRWRRFAKEASLSAEEVG